MGRRFPFSSVRSEGGLLPGDLLQRVAAGDPKLPHADADSYHLDLGRTLGDTISEAWARLSGLHRRWVEARDALPDGDLGTTLTREKWLLPLFSALGYGRLKTARAINVDGRDFAVSHGWDASPVHLVSFRLDLDKRVPGLKGAAASSPHGLLQDLLNRSDDHLWGFVSNGRVLRVLRDHHSLTRMAYVEFDLDQMFGDEQYADFRLLWLICHQSRVEQRPPADDREPSPEGCALEAWHQVAAKAGIAALDQLRDGVESAIAALGAGFLRHRKNDRLREHLGDGRLSTQDYYRQLLRLAYRLIFLFVAEERDVLLDPGAPAEARRRFADFYATARLRDLARARRGGGHGDLWRQLSTVMSCLHEGYAPLGLPALGSFLWSPDATPDLSGLELENADLLAAIRSLDTVHDGALTRPVAWHLVAASELGGIYESLMELHPVVDKDSRTKPFVLQTAAGHERKTTGSYYTPDSLVQCLLDTALDPVLDRAVSADDAEAALLDLKIVDPACGSGHFLVAAARRVADRLARVRTGDAHPAPPDVRRALRDVVGRCIYGVDLNEMAVELCKVALWMEAIEPGRPLSFLDAHIQHGNALLGATPALLERGVPDDAWKPITGDDKAVAKALKARNRKERKAAGQGKLFQDVVGDRRAPAWAALRDKVDSTERAGDDLAQVRAQAEAWQDYLASGRYSRQRFLADLWCAAFVWPKDEELAEVAPTFEMFERVRQDPKECPPETRRTVRRIAGQYDLFHWHLAFPKVFDERRGAALERAGWRGGFDVVLGNPPWERIKIQEKEWFSTRAPGISDAPKAADRKKLIRDLKTCDPPLWQAWQAALRQAEGQSALVRNTARYPLCGRGDINTYSIFAELERGLVRKMGRVAFVVPLGIATDATTSAYFSDTVVRGELVALFGFENEGKLFAGVDHRVNFCILSLRGQSAAEPARFAAFLRHPRQLLDPERTYGLTPGDLRLLNPNTGTCPVFRFRRDAAITIAVYRKVPVLLLQGESESNPWRVSFRTMLHMSGDSGFFRTREDLRDDLWDLDGNVFRRSGDEQLPLYEAKMVAQFDHRFGDFGMVKPGDRAHILPQLDAAEHMVPSRVVLPRYWVPAQEVRERMEGSWGRDWLVGWRDVTDARSSVRTTIFAVLPFCGVGHTMPLLMPASRDATDCAVLVAMLCSFVVDYVCRQMLGGVHLTYTYLRQLPVLPPDVFRATPPWGSGENLGEWIAARATELLYTSWDLEAFAQDAGYNRPPFLWDEERRHLLRAELDAAFFHLYGLARDDVSYVMDTFPIVRSNDEKLFGTFRTKQTILRLFDLMGDAIDSGEPYQTELDPPPAHPSLCHDPSTRPEWATGEGE